MAVDSKVDRLRSHLKNELEELEHHRAISAGGVGWGPTMGPHLPAGAW